MNTNNAFLGTNRMNPFLYQKFGLEQITLRWNGLPIASTPISTQDQKRLFFNTQSALGLLHCGLGITLDNYQQFFFMCFNLTSTQQAAKDFLHPEFFNCTVLLGLDFSNTSTANLAIFVWIYAHPMCLLQPTATLQRTSFQFRQSGNGWYPVAESHSEL